MITLCVHSDEVEQLPPTAILLANNASTKLQAAEVRWDAGIFWGVQYHSEMPTGEIADALRRQSDGIISQQLARIADDVGATAKLLAELDDEPSRTNLLWRFGTSEQVADRVCCTLELRNFINHLVLQRREIRRAERAGCLSTGAFVDQPPAGR